MSKIQCLCGHVISDVICPNEVTGDILSHQSRDKFLEELGSVVDDYLTHLAEQRVAEWRAKHFNHHYPTDLSGGDMIHDVLTCRLRDLTLKMHECDSCGRLLIQRAAGQNEYVDYSPDTASSRTKVLGLNETQTAGR